MSILVTGGTGFIGSRLVNALTKQGETVHILDLAPEHTFRSADPNVRYFSGTITDPVTVERAMTGCDRVFHLAAYARNWAPDERTYHDVNVQGVAVILTVAQKLNVRRIVHTSSNVALGPSNGFQVDEASQRSTQFFTPYEESKYCSEQLVQRYVQSGLDVVIVNPSRVFGPGPLNESNSVTKMIDWYLQGKWRVVLGDGDMVGNYVFVDDLIDGYLRAMNYGKAGERYILGGENVSFNEFFDVLSEVSGRRFRMFHLPARIAQLFARIEEWRSRHLRHYPMITPGWAETFLANWANSCNKAKRNLGYRVTPLRSAFEQTIKWLQEQSASPTVAA